MDQQQYRKLIHRAIHARERAYVPYSDFSVGAALLTDHGQFFTGCNIENKSYPAGLCAERVTMFSAVAAGYRTFEALAVSGWKRGREPENFCMPCGMCLQVISEFCGPEFDIYIVKNEEEVRHLKLKDLLPYVFDSLDR